MDSRPDSPQAGGGGKRLLSPIARSRLLFNPSGLFRGGANPLYHPDVGVVIYYTPKAASIVIAKVFLEAIGELDRALAFHPLVHRYEAQVLIRRSSYNRDVVRAVRAGVPVVQFVRDPLARALSVYLELTRWESLTHRAAWFYHARRAIAGDLHGRDATEAAFSFEEFLEWRVGRPEDRLNIHLKQQVRPRLDRIVRPALLRVEDLERELARFPPLARAYEKLRGTERLASRHHKPKRDMPAEETLQAIRARDRTGPMPHLTIGNCPSDDLLLLLERAFPADMARIAPLYRDGTSSSSTGEASPRRPRR